MPDCEHIVDFAQKLASVEAQSKSNTARLDNLEHITEAVYSLAASVKLIAEKQDQTNELVASLDAKVTTLENKPGKRWDSIVDKIILGIVGALVLYAMARLGLAA